MEYSKIKIGLIVILGLLFGLANQAVAATEDYHLGSGDVLHISVWQEEDMECTVAVSPDGTINYPLIGQVKAAGFTATRLAEEIARLLSRDYFVNPQVAVEIKEYRSQKVYVLGQVDRPGLYYLRGVGNLLEMISQAGGVTEKAARNC